MATDRRRTHRQPLRQQALSWPNLLFCCFLRLGWRSVFWQFLQSAGKPAGAAMRSASAQRNPGRIGVFLARSLGAGFSLPRVLIRCLVAATFEAVGLASKLAFEAVGLASQLCTILSKLTMAPVTLSLAVLGARGGVNQLVLAAATGAVYTVGGCEGLRRSVSFNAHMAPLVLHYKVVQADLRLRRVPQPDRASRYDVMHAQYAAVPLGVALRLGGFYVKICQVMSAFDGIVPRAYTDALRVLQDAVPARPASYVRQLIAQELGVPADNLFESIDEEPLGAASIGQVSLLLPVSVGDILWPCVLGANTLRLAPSPYLLRAGAPRHAARRDGGRRQGAVYPGPSPSPNPSPNPSPSPNPNP